MQSKEEFVWSVAAYGYATVMPLYTSEYLFPGIQAYMCGIRGISYINTAKVLQEQVIGPLYHVWTAQAMLGCRV